MESNQEDAYQIRNRLVDNGYQFCAVINNNKRPVYDHWGQGEDPEVIPLPGALNTGILTKGLRAIDIDVEEPGLVSELKGLAERYLGQDYLLRTRRNSPRCLLLYRSSEPVPPKKVLFDREKGSIEVLGDGQQFVAYGVHPSGAPFEWPNGAPDGCLLSSVPAVSEAQLAQFLAGAAAVLGPPLMSRPAPGPAGAETWPGAFQAGDLKDVESALAQIPNPDCHWEHWSTVGMAIFAATEGSAEGLEQFLNWSAKSSKHEMRACTERWRHWEKSSPPEHVGIQWLCKQANHHNPEWTKPTDVIPQWLWDLRDRIIERSDRERESIASLDHYSEVALETVSRDFVRGLLQDGALVVVYGPSNSGKTFWATSLGMHVASGKLWCDREVQAGAVIYCALEGNAGINQRTFAWAQRFRPNPQSTPFYIWREALDLTGDLSRLKRTIMALASRKQQPVKLIIIDTLSRALSGGDENDGKMMGKLVQVLDALRNETKACILLVHHTGKDSSKGARGHSILRAAVDTEIEIEAVNDEAGKVRSRFAHVRKQRELQGGEDFEFRLDVESLGRDDRGEEITSCVVLDVPDMHKLNASHVCKPRMTDRQKWIIRTAHNITAGQMNEGKREGKYPAMTFKVLVGQLIEENFFREEQLEGAKQGEINTKAYKEFHLELTHLKMLNVLNFNRQLVWPF